MQALQYVRTVRTIVTEMKVSELISLLRPLLDRATPSVTINQNTKDTFASLLFSSRSGYERLTEDPQVTKVLKSLHVDEIYDTARLGRLVSLLSSVANSGQLVGGLPHFYEFFSFYTLLEALANLDKSVSELLEKEKLKPATSVSDLLELQLVDYDGFGIEPIRLERFVALLIQLHRNFALIMNVKDDRLRFIYFDSGTDVLMGIQCAKVVMDGISTLFREWWDRIRFRHFDTFDKRMDALSKGLTILTTVQQAVDSKVVNQETGDLLKTRVLREVDDLIGLGVSVPVVDNEEVVDHRRLLVEKRDTKLLGTGELRKNDS